ncbi:hypothetical protein QR680_018207 [Steinernema hermaphroditum]|uniref:Glycine N-acyltransferase-like protein n=1 Tax=Steinernema hermaphroditum TaxID=289476 RepID=A0AA39HH72_9BILA|nr:hypothetical protein QR680_018207 [Steinernema hermaphroditum]
MAFEVDPQDFQSTLPSLRVFPNFLSIYGTVKLFVNKTIDDCEVRLFGYPKEKPTLWIAYKNNKYGTSFVLAGTTSEDESMYRDAVYSILPYIKESLESKRSFEVVAVKTIMDHVRTFLQTFKHPMFSTLDEPNSKFYINEEKSRKLVKTKIELPEGFEFVSMDESHAQVLLDTMPYASPSDLEMVKSRLANMPAAAVRHVASGKIAAFEYNDGYGSISHLYTFPEFRRMGLGGAVELKLCQANYEQLGILPHKAVSRNRPNVMGMSERSPWWEYQLDGRGEPELSYYVIFSTEDTGKILIFDGQ